MTTPTVEEMEAYAREIATARGMDPDKFVRALRTEGLARGVWQSNVKKNGIREPSYGPMQLLVGGKGTGYPTGLGNKMIEETGIDPSDPANWKAAMDFGADTVAREGWRQWYGPQKAGLPLDYGLTANSKPLGLTLTSAKKLPMIDGPQDNTWADMAAANANKNVPVVAAPPVVADAAVEPTINKTPTLGDKIGTTLFGPSLAAKLKAASTPAVPATATTPATPGGSITQGLGLLSSIMSPKEPAQQQPVPQMQSSLPAVEAADAARSQGASQLMASILAARRQRQGITLNSMGMV
jgi:hypothetical protein